MSSCLFIRQGCRADLATSTWGPLDLWDPPALRPRDRAVPAGGGRLGAAMTTPDLPVDPVLVSAAAALGADVAGARHAAISAEIRAANHAYYVDDNPTLSDAEYDTLFRELVALEAAFPALMTPESPTQRVGNGARPAESSPFAEVRHERPMLSLGNAFGEEELRAFDARVRRGLGLPSTPEPAPDLRYVAELKIDGLAISLRYRDGRFVRGRHARRRDDRRGRHREPSHDRRDPRPPDRAGHARGARRGVHAEVRVRPDQRRAGGGRPGPLREPAQQRRRLAAPARPGRHGRPAAQLLGLPAPRGAGRTRAAPVAEPVRLRSPASLPSDSR